MFDRKSLIILVIAIVAIISAWQYKSNQDEQLRQKKLEIAEAKKIEQEKIIASENKLFMNLSLAIKNKNTQAVMELLNKQIDINKHYKDGNTPLHLAAANKSYEIAYLLLKKGANIDAANEREQTALHIATLSSADQVVFLLIREGANYKLVDNNSDRALDIAARNYDESLLKVLKYLEY